MSKHTKSSKRPSRKSQKELAKTINGPFMTTAKSNRIKRLFLAAGNTAVIKKLRSYQKTPKRDHGEDASAYLSAPVQKEYKFKDRQIYRRPLKIEQDKTKTPKPSSILADLEVGAIFGRTSKSEKIKHQWFEDEGEPYIAEVDIGEVCTQTYTTWARGIGQARRRLRAETNGSIVAIAKLAEGKTIRHWRSR